MPSGSATPPSKPLPPPKRADLISAARDLAYCEWSVIRDDANPHRFDVGGGPEFAAEVLAPVPPTTGTLKAYAWRLVVRAAVARTQTIPDALVQTVDASIAGNVPAGEREDQLLRACRNWVCRQIEHLATEGDSGSDGHLLDPYDALVALIDSSPDALLGEPAQALRAAADVQEPSFRSWKARGNWKPIRATADETSLRKGLKYVMSSAMELRIVVVTSAPLEFTVMPGDRYEGRFEPVLTGADTRSAREAGRTMMLRALVNLVERLDAKRAREWLPTVAWDRLDDPDVQQAATRMLKEEVRRRLMTLLAEQGVEPFEKLAAAPA
jgi:hypothetical protein